MSKVKRMHYVPAMYLKQFSYEKTGKGRSRKIFAIQKEELNKLTNLKTSDIKKLIDDERTIKSYCTRNKFYSQENERNLSLIEKEIHDFFTQIDQCSNIRQLMDENRHQLWNFILSLNCRTLKERIHIENKILNTNSGINAFTNHNQVIENAMISGAIFKSNIIQVLTENHTEELFITCDNPVINQLGVGFEKDVIARITFFNTNHYLHFPLTPHLLYSLYDLDSPNLKFPPNYKIRNNEFPLQTLHQSQKNDIRFIREINANIIYYAQNCIFLPTDNPKMIISIRKSIDAHPSCLNSQTYSKSVHLKLSNKE